jgi:hypothetical protein
VRGQRHTVELELIERVIQFCKTRDDVGQRQNRVGTEPIGMAAFDLAGVVVDRPAQRDGARLIDEVEVRRRHREHRAGDADFVHDGQRALGRPCGRRHPTIERCQPRVTQRILIHGRQEVCVNVDRLRLVH